MRSFLSFYNAQNNKHIEKPEKVLQCVQDKMLKINI